MLPIMSINFHIMNLIKLSEECNDIFFKNINVKGNFIEFLLGNLLIKSDSLLIDKWHKIP